MSTHPARLQAAIDRRRAQPPQVVLPKNTQVWDCALISNAFPDISIIKVPARLGIDNPLLPTDLDVYLWISRPEPGFNSIFDLNSNQLRVEKFPLDEDINTLEYVYTFFYRDQKDLEDHNSTLNKTAASIADHAAAPWYGEIVVTKTRFTAGIMDVDKTDVPIIRAILNRILLNGHLASSQ